METPGIIKIRSESVFHRCMRSLTCKTWDIVGFYYNPGGIFYDQVKLLIYDVYTGKRIIEGDGTLEQMRKCNCYSSYSMARLNSSDHERTFKSALSRLIVNGVHTSKDNIVRSLRAMIPQLIGITDDIPMNGYLIVNQVLAAIDGQDYSSQKDKLSRELIDSPYFSTPIVYQLETQDSLIMSYKMELTLFFEVVSSLMLHTQSFRERAIGLLSSPIPFQVTTVDQVDEDPSILDHIVKIEDQLFEAMEQRDETKITGLIIDLNNLRRTSNHRVVNYTSPPDTLSQIRQPLTTIRHQLETILHSLKNQTPAVLDISTLVDQYNLMAKLAGGHPLTNDTQIRSGSYTSLMVAGSQGLQSNKITLSLRSGSTIILPSVGADVKDLDTEILEEVLLYLDSLPDSDKRFTTLKIILTRELSYRKDT